MITVDALGQACPIPVVKTRQAIAALNGAAGEVETLVDNEIAVQNLTKMAEQKGYGNRSEQTPDGNFRVVMNIPAGDGQGAGQADASAAVSAAEAGTADAEASAEAAVCDCGLPEAVRPGTIAVISSDTMGEGSKELGAKLIKAFIFALSQQDKIPEKILFYNGGVKLTTENDASIDDLKSMAERGTRIYSCGTCLSFYGLTEQLKVGEVTNMYDIVDMQMKAARILKP